MKITEDSFKIIVKANSSKNEVLGFDKDKAAYRVAIKEKAENNKANVEIIKFFKKELKKDVKIVKGLRSKEKVIKVIDIS